MIWLLICSVTQTSANMAFVFIIWSYFAAQKNTRLNSTHYFIMKIPNKQELKQIAIKHSSAIDFKDSGGGGLKFSIFFFEGGREGGGMGVCANNSIEVCLLISS